MKKKDQASRVIMKVKERAKNSGVTPTEATRALAGAGAGNRHTHTEKNNKNKHPSPRLYPLRSLSANREPALSYHRSRTMIKKKGR